MKNFFKGISVSQIIAGALAAVTSFLLSAKIGIAGSLIGVAVGSIVSAVASQIYQNVLKESGKKLQENLPQNDDTAQQGALGANSDDETRVIGSDAQRHGQLTNRVAVQSVHGTPVLRMDGTSPRLAALARTEKIEPDSEQKDTTKTLDANGQDGKNGSDKTAVENSKGKAANDATGVLAPAASGKTTVMSPVDQKQTTKAAATITRKKLKSGPGQSDGHIRVFDSSKQKRYKRLAVVVAVVSALVAVGITAGIISLATKGQGTDDVVRKIVTNSTTKTPRQQKDDSGNTSTDGNQKTDNGTKKNDSTTNQNNSGTTSDSGTQSGSTSNNQGNSSSSGNSNGSNSGSTNSGSTNSGGTNSSGTTSGTTGSGTSSDSNSSSSGSTDSSHNSTHTGSGSTDSGSTGSSTSGGTGTNGNESGAASGTHTGSGTTPGTTSSTKK